MSASASKNEIVVYQPNGVAACLSLFCRPLLPSNRHHPPSLHNPPILPTLR